LPAGRARGFGGRASEGPRPHLAPAQVARLPVAPDARRGCARALRDHPRGGREVLSVPIRELLEAAGPSLGLRLVAGARGLERPIELPRLQQPGLALAGYLAQLHPDRIEV